MEILLAILLFFGMSQDSFVTMMSKGATIRELSLPRAILYAMTYALADVIAILVGYGISTFVDNLLVDRIEMVCTCVVIFSIGLYLVFKAVRMKELEERLDKTFGFRNCFLLALAMSADMLLLGIGYALFAVRLRIAILLVFLITFVTTFAGILWGYYQGARYYRVFGYFGGALMMATAIYILVRFVIGLV